MTTDYRFDGRTKEEFSKDIKELSLVEAEIILRLCIVYKNTHEKWPKLSAIGTDHHGEYSKKASGKADFKIANTNIEVTHSANLCSKTFHEKVGKVNRCISGEQVIIFVNGFVQFEEPRFLYIRPARMEQLVKQSLEKYGVKKMPSRGTATIVDKEAYRFDIGWFAKKEWFCLPKLEEMPEQYSDIYNLVKNNGKK